MVPGTGLAVLALGETWFSPACLLSYICTVLYCRSKVEGKRIYYIGHIYLNDKRHLIDRGFFFLPLSLQNIPGHCPSSQAFPIKSVPSHYILDAHHAIQQITVYIYTDNFTTCV
jgi:hypothetical protein